MSSYMIEISRRESRRYYQTGDPVAALRAAMYYDMDLDMVPDYLEVVDYNPRTTLWRTNYVFETTMIGRERRGAYPF